MSDKKLNDARKRAVAGKPLSAGDRALIAEAVRAARGNIHKRKGRTDG